jgi:myo-inositol-1(or 4)-monophosphatase
LPDVDDLALLLGAVRDGGDLALDMQKRGVKQWEKPDHSIVTEADLAVDELLKTRISTSRPDDGWLSEETKDTPQRLQHARVWIADPIDGTRAFASGIQHWGTGMALVENGRPIASAVYFPAEYLMFHAVKNGGAFLNGERLATSIENNAAPVIAPRRFHKHFSNAFSIVHQSSSYPLLLRIASIATGKIRAAISQGNKHDWDLAAGHLILTEAGGVISDLNGDEMIYNRPNPWQLGLIASATLESHATLLKLVRTT